MKESNAIGKSIQDFKKLLEEARQQGETFEDLDFEERAAAPEIEGPQQPSMPFPYGPQPDLRIYWD